MSGRLGPHHRVQTFQERLAGLCSRGLTRSAASQAHGLGVPTSACPAHRSPRLGPEASKTDAASVSKTAASTFYDPPSPLRSVEEGIDVVSKPFISFPRDARNDFPASVGTVAQLENCGSALIQLYRALGRQQDVFAPGGIFVQLMPRCQPNCAPGRRCLALHALAPTRPLRADALGQKPARRVVACCGVARVSSRLCRLLSRYATSRLAASAGPECSRGAGALRAGVPNSQDGVVVLLGPRYAPCASGIPCLLMRR